MGHESTSKHTPNIFTPNGDGENDEFKINALTEACFDTYEVAIFNRWGNKIYESSDILFEWNGKKRNGQDAKDGTYYYGMKVAFGSDELKRKGYVTLIR